MATTSPDNLWSPDGSDGWDLTVDLAAMQNSVQTALGYRAQRRVFSSIEEREAWATASGTRLTHGDVVYVGTTKYEWDGPAVAWRRHGSKVLFSNDSQPLQGAVTLSETAANWDALTICFRSDDNDFGSVEVVNPNGKRVALNLTTYNGYGMWLKTRVVLINGTTIDTAKNGDAWIAAQVQPEGSNSVTVGDFLGITQVIGHSIP